MLLVGFLAWGLVLCGMGGSGGVVVDAPIGVDAAACDPALLYSFYP